MVGGVVLVVTAPVGPFLRLVVPNVGAVYSLRRVHMRSSDGKIGREVLEDG